MAASPDAGRTPLATRRVVFLVPDLLGSYGGIARHGQTVCRALGELGCSLTVIALNDAPGRGRDAAFLAGAEYRPCAGSRIAFVRQALAALREQPVLVLVEHVHFSVPAWVVARLARARLVVFAHGIEIWDQLPLLRRLALRRADRLIAVSRLTMERAAASNGMPLSKARVLPNCLPPTFETAPVREYASESLSLLTVARLSAGEGYKGHDQVIRCLPALLREFPSLVYNIVGDGDLRPQLERLAAGEGVAHAVRFHGSISEESLRELYANASVFVMPSRAEGFGYVFVEAMAYGTPVVAGNGDGAAEVVRDGESGFLVDPADVITLSARLTLLLRDRDLRERMGTAGRMNVCDEFSYAAFRDRLAACIDHLLDP